MSQRTRMRNKLQELADLMPMGSIMIETDPEELLNQIKGEIVDLREINGELLEALKVAYSLYGMTDDELMTNWGRVFDCIRAAIAKTKGEK